MQDSSEDAPAAVAADLKGEEDAKKAAVAVSAFKSASTAKPSPFKKSLFKKDGWDILKAVVTNDARAAARWQEAKKQVCRARVRLCGGGSGRLRCLRLVG